MGMQHPNLLLQEAKELLSGQGWMKTQEGSQVNYIITFSETQSCSLWDSIQTCSLIQNLLLPRVELPGRSQFQGPGQGHNNPGAQQPWDHWTVCGCHPASGESSSWGGWENNKLSMRWADSPVLISLMTGQQ